MVNPSRYWVSYFEVIVFNNWNISFLHQARERLRNCDNTFQSGSEVSPSLQSSMRSSQLKSSSVSVDSVLKSSHHDRQSASSEDLPPYQEIVSTENIRTTPSCKSLKSDSSQLSKFKYWNNTKKIIIVFSLTRELSIYAIMSQRHLLWLEEAQQSITLDTWYFMVKGTLSSA